VIEWQWPVSAVDGSFRTHVLRPTHRYRFDPIPRGNLPASRL